MREPGSTVIRRMEGFFDKEEGFHEQEVCMQVN